MAKNTASHSSHKLNPYRNAEFLLSVNKWNQLPAESEIEVAFAGRSNAGKSSAINAITDIKTLCRTLTEYDMLMLQWCQRAEMPAHILLTKADKFKRGAAQNILLKVKRTLKEEYPGTTIQLFSALKKTGLDEARSRLDQWFMWDDSVQVQV